MENLRSNTTDGKWPERPNVFPELMTTQIAVGSGDGLSSSIPILSISKGA